MKYNFDEEINRRNTDSVKWDECPENVLPLWVADMDFKAAPAIREALEKRVAHGVYGYSFPRKEFYEAFVSWFKRRHDWEIKPEWMIVTPGIVPALSAIVMAFVKPGEKVLIMPPVYNCFFSSVRNNGCILAECPLTYDGKGHFDIDWEKLEETAADPDVKLMILCNPHNPAGKLWTKDELKRIGEICLRNKVIVAADEIHCEFAYNGYKYTPFASISEEFAQNCVACISPSKAFNIAGLHISSIVCPNPEIRAKVDKAININEVCDVNPFGIVGAAAAYNEGEEWLEQMLDYVWGNWLAMKDYCERELPEFPLADLHATYLAWMDCSALDMKSEELRDALVSEAGLMLSPGSIYGSPKEGFMRWNLATTRKNVMEALRRFKAFADKKMAEK